MEKEKMIEENLEELSKLLNREFTDFEKSLYRYGFVMGELFSIVKGSEDMENAEEEEVDKIEELEEIKNKLKEVK
jgi:hypothetical protein